MNQIKFQNRFVVKATGESGMGVNSVGEIIAKALKDTGLYIFGYREYPSLIKGGYASYQIDIANREIKSSSKECDLMMCLDRRSFHAYLSTIRHEGNIIHNIINLRLSPEEQALVDQKAIQIFHVATREIAEKIGGNRIMANTVMIGVIWQILGLETKVLEDMTREIFAKKPDVIEPNLKCLQAGYEIELEGAKKAQLQLRETENFKDDLLMTGNYAIALAAIAAGVRAYYAYPMTPSSSILSYLSSVSHETGMLVKQIEDEISVANMAVGSMFAGARTMIGTSGGGFDLMTETMSLAGMIETPFVCVLGQRPGPATGLPTWTSAADLNLAVYAGHGEYSRLVIAVSDVMDAYALTQHALNFAEKYQIPVLLMTEKQIAESVFQVDRLPENIPIDRHILTDEEAKQMKPEDRYKITESGVSPRWLPGQADATYRANSDEHLPDGTLTEDAEPSKAMYDKRLRKEISLLAELPEPQIYGDQDNPDISFVGWGSTKNVMLDIIQLLSEFTDKKIAYLHYQYIYPVKTQVFTEYSHKANRLVLIENNALGQLGQLLGSKTGIQFWEKLLKYDGRPFFVEDVLEFILSENEGNQ
jgi:2-oxoglutarate/2-oxoacid ferredoxin oxidoreductase subunit alpha